MKLERLLYLAGIKADDESVEEGKYDEPKANHAKKDFATDKAHAKGKSDVKAPEGKLNTPSGSKYNEPKAKGKKTGGKEVTAPEGELKSTKTSKYADNTSTK